MNALTIKLPQTLDEEIARLARKEHLSKSELVRKALVAYVQERGAAPPQASALDAVSDLAGCFSGGPGDLSSNPAHLTGFGQR